MLSSLAGRISHLISASDNEKGADESLLEATYNESTQVPSTVPRSRTRDWRGLPVHTCILSLYTTAFIWLWFHVSTIHNQNENSMFLLPPQDAMKLERKTFYLSLDDVNPYKGRPRPELDQAWRDLVAPTAFRYPGWALEKINRTSLPLKDNSGHVVTLDVYHQLHCLKFVRQYIHPEYYTINQTRLEDHLDHCLDGIRQHIMCHADPAPNTYQWIPDYDHPWPVFNTEHQCINWEKFHAWALENSFNGFDENLISNPDFRPEMPPPFEFKLDKSNMPLFDQHIEGRDAYEHDN